MDMRPLTPEQLARFDEMTGYETPERRSNFATARRAIGGIVAVALSAGVVGSCLSATPAYAQDPHAYSKTGGDAERAFTIETLPNGARADFALEDCDGLAAVVDREVLSRGLERGGLLCDAGRGSVEVYGDVPTAVAALNSVVEQSMESPSQTLTPAEIAVEQAMVDAVKARLTYTTPGNTTNPRDLILRPGPGNSVIGVLDITQHLITGQYQVSAEGTTVFMVEYVPTMYQGRNRALLRFNILSASSNIVDPASQAFYVTRLCLNNGEGANNPCIDNTTTGKKGDTRLAQGDWTNALKNAHAHKLNGRDRLTFDNLSQYVISNRVCTDIETWNLPGNCSDTVLTLVRKEAAENYFGRLVCADDSCGTAVVGYVNAYDAAGRLTNDSRATLETTSLDWTFSKEMVQHLKSPEPGLSLWEEFEGRTTLVYRQEGNTLLDAIRYVSLFADDSLTHLAP